MGPLFFLVYINDLAEDLRCNVKLFADDTSLFTVVEDSNAAAIDMNHDLELINQWAHTGTCTPKTKVPQKPQGQLKGNIYRRSTYNIKLLLINDA